jgi:hypothetical protein
MTGQVRDLGDDRLAGLRGERPGPVDGTLGVRRHHPELAVGERHPIAVGATGAEPRGVADLCSIVAWSVLTWPDGGVGWSVRERPVTRRAARMAEHAG